MTLILSAALVSPAAAAETGTSSQAGVVAGVRSHVVDNSRSGDNRDGGNPTPAKVKPAKKHKPSHHHGPLSH